MAVFAAEGPAVEAPMERTRTREFAGGMIAAIAYYAITLLVGLGFAAVTDPADFRYDFSMLRAIVYMATSAQAVWLLVKRADVARHFCIIATCVNLAITVLDLFVFGAFDEIAARIGFAGAATFVGIELAAGAAIAIYLSRSTAMREVLSRPLDNRPEGEGNSWQHARLRDRIRTLTFWRDTSLYFMVFSFLGHWAEMLFCRLIILGVFMGDYDPSNAMLWDQWLFPFSAEGIALAMVVIVLHPLKERLLARFNGRVLPALLASFAINAAVCTSIDFLTGMAVNQDFSLWDYRALPFNFMGQVCLQNSMVYSIAATLIVWVFYPMMDRFLRKIPRSWANGIFFGIFGLYAFEAMLHFIYPSMWM